MPIVNRGLIAATASSKIIVGTDTRFLDDNVQAGALLSFVDAQGRITTPLYVVESVEDDTHLTLVQAYAGSTGPGKSYALLDVAYEKTSADVFNLLATKTDQIEEVLDKANGAAAQGNFAVLGAGGKLSTNILNTNADGGVPKLNSFGKVDVEQLPLAVQNSNANLLDNWDFKNPVNQRKQSTYLNTSASISTIDRWIAGANMRVELISPGIRLTALTSNYRRFSQRIERSERMTAQTVTVSLDVIEATGGFSVYFIYGSSFEKNTSGMTIDAGFSGIKSFTVTLPGYSDTAGNLALMISSRTDADVSITIRTVMLEMGSVSTLKPNAVSHYGEQESLCKRFLIPISKDQRFRAVGVFPSALQFTIPIPQTLRVMPSIENIAAFALKTLSAADIPGVAISNIEMLRMDTALLVRVTTSAPHGLTDALLYLNEATFLNAEM